MPSRYEEALRNLASEEDEASRIELAASLDSQVEELNERYDNREVITSLESQLNDVVQERDSWKQKYSDRFFDPGEGDTGGKVIIDKHTAEVQSEGKPQSFDALWESR